MKKILKVLCLLQVLLVAFLSAYVYRLPAQGRQALLRDIQLLVNEKKLPKNFWRNVSPVNKELEPSAETELVKPQGLNKNLPKFRQEYFQKVGCYKAPTSKLAARKQAVYRWQDANGRWHFSDKKQGAAEDISSSLVSSMDYFHLNFFYHGQTMPAFLRMKITSHVEQIYKFLASFMAKDQLRKLTLNIHLFEQPKDFQAHRLAIAPDASTNTGFYSLRHHQAVIQQQASEQQTLAIVLHEASHIIMASLFGQTPVWLNEGFAEFNERLVIVGQQKHSKPAQAYWRMLSGRSFPVDFWGYDHQQFYQADNKGFNYATAWALVYYLLQHSPATFQAMLQTLHQAPCTVLDAKAIIAKNYPGYEQFIKDWRQWLTQPAPRDYYY